MVTFIWCNYMIKSMKGFFQINKYTTTKLIIINRLANRFIDINKCMGNQAFFPETKLKWIKSLNIFGRTWWVAWVLLATGFEHFTDSILCQATDKSSLPLTMCLSKTVWCCNKIFSSAEEPDLDLKSVPESSANWHRASQWSSSIKLNAINSRFKAHVSSFGNSNRKIQIIQQTKGFSNGQTGFMLLKPG